MTDTDHREGTRLRLAVEREDVGEEPDRGVDVVDRQDEMVELHRDHTEERARLRVDDDPTAHAVGQVTG